MGRVSIAPPDRLRRRVVMANVSSNFASEIRHRREDAARQEFALDLREPELDFEPRRVHLRLIRSRGQVNYAVSSVLRSSL